MMSAYVLMFKWLLAGVSCALAGLAMYYLLNAALRVWPALAARRAVWLAAQMVVAGAPPAPATHAARRSAGNTSPAPPARN